MSLSFGSRDTQENLSDLDRNGYYNKTIHTCILKLHIPKEIINEIYKQLYNENEVSGVFYVDEDDKITHVDQNEGDSGSVYTPNNVINYHTHPINAYRNGKTCYGSPSGEDYRECLKFALAGNKAHLVFTVEGIYTIQVSPCKIKKMRELLDDVERGVLVFFVEEYFKSIHEFRCVDELNDLASGDTHVNPYSFVDFANTFDIINLLTTKKKKFKKPKKRKISQTGHSSIHSKNNVKLYSGLPRNFSFSRIPNMGFPVINDDHVITKPANQFLSRDDLDNLHKISENGKESSTEPKSIKELTKILKKIAVKFEAVPCEITWNNNPNAWFFVNFFPSEYYVSESNKKGNRHVMPPKDADGLYLNHEPFIRIFSNSKTGCKITDIAQRHNFNMGKLFKFGAYSSGRCTCCYNISNEIKYLKQV
jgi:hypothetical protein